MKSTIVLLITVTVLSICTGVSESRGVAGNIKLVLMRNNQYWFSSTSPFSPSLNFFLAYEYCRNLGLQLVTLDSKEEVDSIAVYLASSEGNSLNGLKEYWTSGNKLGADAWLWMSNGEQLNSTFVAENALHQRQVGGPPRNCLTVRGTTTRRAVFNADDCEKHLPFICEQIRCLSYYYPTVEFSEQTETEFGSQIGQRSEIVIGNETVSN